MDAAAASAGVAAALTSTPAAPANLTMHVERGTSSSDDCPVPLFSPKAQSVTDEDVQAWIQQAQIVDLASASASASASESDGDGAQRASAPAGSSSSSSGWNIFQAAQPQRRAPPLSPASSLSARSTFAPVPSAPAAALAPAMQRTRSATFDVECPKLRPTVLLLDEDDFSRTIVSMLFDTVRFSFRNFFCLLYSFVCSILLFAHIFFSRTPRISLSPWTLAAVLTNRILYDLQVRGIDHVVAARSADVLALALSPRCKELKLIFIALGIGACTLS
jgi:hypothetical protein